MSPAIQTRTTSAERRRRERFPFLLFVSCLIHATLIILLTIFIATRVTEQKRASTKEPPPPEVTLEIPPPQERPFIEAKEETTQSSKQAPFESNENTKANSEKPPEGQLPLPSQEGVTQAALELQNQRFTPGEKPATTAGNPVPPLPPSPPNQPAQDTKEHTTPSATPLPTQTPTPHPSITPQASPTPTPPPNNIKLLELPKDEPTPAPTPVKSSETNPKETQTTPPQPSSVPGATGNKKGYQPETRQTVIQGNISNRGRSSVAAEATPIGRYKKSMADAIGSRWYYYVNERMGLLSIGTVNVSFKITSSGKVTGIHVVSSNSNQSLTDCSLRSIMEAKLPPIPPEVAKTLQDGSLEIEYSFSIY